MSVKLRLRRMGKKKQPFYRIVAIDSRSRRDGKYIEKLGHYNPLTQPAEIAIDREKAIKWLDQGAIPSDTVKSFLRRNGIVLEWDLRKKGLEPDRIAEELKKWEEAQVERQKRREAKAAMAKRKQEPVAEEPAAQEASAPAVQAAPTEPPEA